MSSSHRDTWKVVAIVWAIAIILMLLTWAVRAYAQGDASKWGHDPATSQWFQSLKNGNGTPCCDYADGTRLEDPGDYRRNDDGSYEVSVDGVWTHVGADRVLKGTNRVGYAILWRQNGPPGTIWCFLPGSLL